jgi:Sec-independent protein translocase protein TatA
MFGLGLVEILVILLVALVFVNPRDLPAFFRRVGRLVGQLRELKDASAAYLRKVEREIEEADRRPDRPAGGADEKRQGPIMKTIEEDSHDRHD